MGFIVWFLPAIVLASAGTTIGWWGPGFGLAFVWIGFCIYQGSMIVGQQEWFVIERLGKFKTVYFRGWHVRVIGVDTVRAEGTLCAQRLQLYSDDNATDIDFTDASAPIDASIWYQVGNPDDIANAKWKDVAESVKAWIYTYAKPIERIEDLADGGLRPLLQAKTIDEASTDRNGIADTVMGSIAPEMAKFGAYSPSADKRLIIEDVAIPPHVIELREMALEGEKRAQESENEAGGYWKSIKAIKDNLSVSVEVARSIYETQRGLDTLEKTKPSLTLMGKDLNGVLGTISLGSREGGMS